MSDGAAARPAAGRPLRVCLAGVEASLESTDEEFAEFAAAHLAPLHSDSLAVAQMSALLRWHEGPPADRLAQGSTLTKMDRVDRDLYRGEGELVWFRIDELRDLRLRFAWDGERLRVEGDYYHRLSKTPGRDQMTRLLYRRRLPELRRRRFTTILYYLLYYPVFWLLERHGWHPIHAGGVALPRGIAVFAGPSGVGKSTTVTGLALTSGAQLLSDTFLMHRGAEVRAVAEPILIDEHAQRWIGAENRLLQRVPHRYGLGREGYQLPSSRLCGGGRAGVLLFPYRGRSHALRRLPTDHARGRLRAGDLIVNDLRRYWAFAAVLELLDPTPLVSYREASLAELFAAVPAYEIGLTQDRSPEQVAAMVSNLIE